jgi:peptide/nickel transport system substrate-binding protein
MTRLRSSPRRFRPAASWMLLLGAAAACRERGAGSSTADGAPSGSGAAVVRPAGDGGTVVIATAGDAESLLPPLASGVTARQATDLLFDPLAELGAGLNTVGDDGFRPRLARAWTWAPDSLSIAFALDPRARWHDGAPVTAEDVRFTFTLYRDPALGAPGAADVAGVDSVTVRDSATAVAWFRRRSPEQFYSAAARLRILPSHLLARVPAAELRASDFARRPVGSGRFRFAGWDPQRRLELVADTAHARGRPRLDRVVWTVASDPAAALALLLSGDADVFEGLRPEHLAAIARRPELRTVPYPGLQYGFLAFNVGAAGAAPLGDRAVRRALTQALDRPGMVRNVFDTLAAVPIGPFTRAQALVDTAARQLPLDAAASRRTLDSLGWLPGPGGGVRRRGGRPLEFTIAVPRSSETRARFAVLIQEQLRAVGVAARVEPLEFTAFMERLATRRFDAVINVWNLDNPSPWGVQELWGSAAARTGGQLELRRLRERRLRRRDRQRARRDRAGRRAAAARARAAPDQRRRAGRVALRAAAAARRAPPAAGVGRAPRRVVGRARRLDGGPGAAHRPRRRRAVAGAVNGRPNARPSALRRYQRSTTSRDAPPRATRSATVRPSGPAAPPPARAARVAWARVASARCSATGVSTGRPAAATMTSPARSPASAAGVPGSTWSTNTPRAGAPATASRRSSSSATSCAPARAAGPNAVSAGTSGGSALR